MTMIPSPVPAAINHLLSQEPWARENLARHVGKVACLNTGFLIITLKITPDAMVQTAAADEMPDVTIHVKPADLVLMIQYPQRLFSYVRIEGDADFANTLSQLSQTLHWEMEEDLSKWIGNIAAARIVAGTRQAWSGIKSTHRKLAENIAEYLVEENPTLVRPQAVVDFTGEVGKLRDDVERLIKRLERLQVKSVINIQRSMPVPYNTVGIEHSGNTLS
jgi:ubiquinone biosynthesis accessory factor UbiJ